MVENLENEIWVENNGYKISNKGRLTRKKDGKLQKMGITSYGYVCGYVVFEDGFIARNVHRAVAYAFIGKPLEGQEVNHIDGVKTNNCVENLEWVSKKENQQHEARVLKQRNGVNNYLNNITEKEVIEVYNLCKEGKMLYKDIAKMYNISKSRPSMIASGNAWKHLGLNPIILKQGSRGKGRSWENRPSKVE